MNVVVLEGVLSSAPEARILKSGDRLVSFEVTVRAEGRPTETAPVRWLDPPARAAELPAGTAVVVTGRLHRRFFRAGGAVQSRTEVAADAVIPVRQRKRVAAALDAVVEALPDPRG